MKGPGGVQLGEFGQSIAQSAKQQATQWGNATVSQVSGKPIGQNTPSSGSQGLPKAPDAQADFGKALENNSSQQIPTVTSSQQAPRVSHEAEFKQQNETDQKTLSATRNEIDDLIEKMKKATIEREETWEKRNTEEKEEKKMDDWQQEQQNQKPVLAGSKNPEGPKNGG